eukprot:7061517-Ditylum_brightwellii.AAC.1
MSTPNKLGKDEDTKLARLLSTPPSRGGVKRAEQEAAAANIATATQNLQDKEEDTDNDIIPPDIDLKDCNIFSDIGEEFKKELDHLGNPVTRKEVETVFVEEIADSVKKNEPQEVRKSKCSCFLRMVDGLYLSLV